MIAQYKKMRLQRLWDAIRQRLHDEKNSGKLMSRVINRMLYFD